MSTQTSSFEISYDDEPTRVIRGQVERPEEAGDGALPWLMLVHGFKGFMDWGFFPLLSRGLAASGFQVLRFNLSGSGVGADGVDFSDLESFAKDSYGRQLEDMARVYELASAGEFGAVEPGRSGFFGHSRGGGMGLVHAAEHAYRAVVTWAAIDHPDRFEPAVKALWKSQGFLDVPNQRTKQTMRMNVDGLLEYEADPERFSVQSAATRVEAPTLVVHGTADETVDPEAAERLSKALTKGRKLILKGANHTLGSSHPLDQVSEALGQALAATTEHFLTHV